MNSKIPSLAIAVMSLVGSGCGSGVLPLGSVQMTFFGNTGSEAFMYLDYDDTKMGCRRLPEDFSASMSGGPVDVDHGGSEGLNCHKPGLRGLRPELFAESMVMEASSEGEQVVVEIEGVGQRLGGQLVLEPGVPPRAGQSIRIALDPGFNRLTWPSTGWVFSENNSWSTTITVLPPSVDGMLDVQLPDASPAGRMHVRAPAKSVPRFTRCEFAGCAFSIAPPAAEVDLEVAFDVVQ